MPREKRRASIMGAVLMTVLGLLVVFRFIDAYEANADFALVVYDECLSTVEGFGDIPEFCSCVSDELSATLGYFDFLLASIGLGPDEAEMTRRAEVASMSCADRMDA